MNRNKTTDTNQASNKLDELIYHTEAAEKMFNHNIATQQQTVQGEKVFVCMMCGHSPATIAKILREIKAEL